MILFILVIQTT